MAAVVWDSLQMPVFELMWNNTQMACFVWTPLLILIPNCVGSSQVVQKNLLKNNKQQRMEGRNTNMDSELQMQESEVGTLAF